jgi:hypothetical protein
LPPGKCLRHNRYHFSILADAGKGNNAILGGKNSVVFADSNIITGMDPGASLADYNRSGMDPLASVSFDSHSLAVGITAVTRGPYAFFMSHYEFLSLSKKQKIHNQLQAYNIVIQIIMATIFYQIRSLS